MTMSEDGAMASACSGKFRHESRGAAAATAKVIRRKNRGAVVLSYPCRYCHGWHVGNKPKTRRHTHP